MAGQWFSLGTPVSLTNKTDHHDITEILMKVALSTINPNPCIYAHPLNSLLCLQYYDDNIKCNKNPQYLIGIISSTLLKYHYYHFHCERSASFLYFYIPLAPSKRIENLHVCFRTPLCFYLIVNGISMYLFQKI